MSAPFRILDSDPFVPSVLDGMPFAAEFRYWTGGSGERYLTRAFPLELAAEFPGAPVVLAAVDEEGRREALWIGIAAGRQFDAALAAARSAGATEAHVHLLARGAVARVEVLRDLRAAAHPRASARRPDGARVVARAA
ncbi:hypothetical protein EDC22_103106 [Tepidamorphus gemmatus]|jgi:hypothetical protein|uniref:Uncharacterized protein n=1 Tax=Tepidamorphus gemmatus TaxID=747076 RepID=A0A4R3MDG0_9HYPH|nr:hypothetical protein [Tepidamorphus gemmatus]TCT11794.1 hypothetical protein EDC22_103106 [Tepidamorphus gemmatus]